MTTRPAPCGEPLLYAADNLSLYHAREKPSDGEEHSHDDIQIAIPLSAPTHTAWQSATGGQRRQRVPPGSLLVTPSRQPHTVQVRTETELAAVWLPAPCLAHTAEGPTARGAAEISDAGAARDPLLHRLCLSLLAEVRQDTPPLRLYVDAMADLMAAHLVRHYSTAKAPRSRPSGGLSPRALRRVTDYIRDHLDRDTSLADLAACVHLSPYHFARLFKQSIGQSPHRYVIAQRVERAKALLLSGRLSVGEAAHAVGFGSQAHLNRHFKRLTGLTPTEFQRGR